MIQFHPSFTLAEVARIANHLDAKIVATRDGHHIIVPRRAIPAQGNGNVVKLPRRKRQFMHTRLPEPPEVA